MPKQSPDKGLIPFKTHSPNNNTLWNLKKIYTGLNAQEVAENRKKYGENLLTPPAQIPLWKRFITKFKDPLIIILLVAGVLSIAISFYEYHGLHEGTEVFSSL